jgi:4-hydroxybenzoate polyprenyltransferase
MGVVKFVAAWVMVIFVGALAAIILWKIWTGKIDLTKLISEKNGDASMSRFQFLVFTFVVVLMWIYLFFCKDCTGFPHIDSSVLGLLGISSGSYVVSKGIQKSHETEVEKAQAAAAKQT